MRKLWQFMERWLSETIYEGDFKMKTYYGKNGTKYKLYEKPLGTGGEGSVYNIENDSHHVAKIYHEAKKFDTEAKRTELQKKIETMLSMHIQPVVDGVLRIAWPQDILFDNHKFVGYVMPKVSAPYKIFHITRDDRTKIFQNYTWKYSIQYAYNLSWVVWYLHINDIVIGDMNMNNIAVDTTGQIVLIDCDSFDIRNPRTKEHFKCEVGLPELLAPELQTVGQMKNGTFTKESDNFSLAIHIFRLLMNNTDPFNARVVGINVNSQSAINLNSSIINGECPYFRKVPHKKIPQWAPKLDLLPSDIITAFERTFSYTQTTILKSAKQRTTAEEWNRILFEYAKAEPNPMLKTCPNNPSHVYPAHHTVCPFCLSEKLARRKGFLCKIKNLFGVFGI